MHDVRRRDGGRASIDDRSKSWIRRTVLGKGSGDPSALDGESNRRIGDERVSA
jgi:hypothetical protein